MKNMLLVLSVMGLMTGAALADAPDQSPVTMYGVTVKADLPGTLMGNENSDKPENDKKVYICHATSAVNKNGYVMIHAGNPAGAAHLAHEHATPNGNGQEKAQRDFVGLDPAFECRAPY